MPPWPGNYNMLTAAEAQLQVALDREAEADMLVHRWEPTADIMSRWRGDPAPAKTGAMIAKYYYKTSGYSAKVFTKEDDPAWGDSLNPDNNLNTEFGIKLMRRPPSNNRDEDVSREVYMNDMLSQGYSCTARSPTVLCEASC